MERVKSYDRLLDRIDQSLWQEARRVAPITSPELLANAQMTRVARVQAEQSTLQARLAEVENQWQAATNRLLKAQRQFADGQDTVAHTGDALTNAQQQFNRAQTNAAAFRVLTGDQASAVRGGLAEAQSELDSARTNLGDAATRLTNALTDVAVSNPVFQASQQLYHMRTELCEAAHAVAEAHQTLAEALASASVTNLPASAVVETTNYLAKAQAQIDEVQTNLSAVGTAVPGLQQVRSNQLAKTKVRLNNAGTYIHQATNALALAWQELAQAGAANPANLVAEMKGHLDVMRGQYHAATNTLNSAGMALADATRSRAELGERLDTLLWRSQFATQRETNAGALLFQLEQASAQKTLALVALAGPTNTVFFSVDGVEDIEAPFKKLARLLWLNSLSGPDIVSVGMNGDVNPIHFRKLVFWTKTKVSNLDQVSGDVDTILGQVTDIGRSYKNIGRQQAAAQQTRAAAALEVLQAIQVGATNQAVLTNVIKMLVPTAFGVFNEGSLPDNLP